MIKVLIVDDERLLRTNIKAMMAKDSFGYTVCGEAVNGAEALKKIKQEQPHILLCDVQMPVMNGLQLSTEVMKQYPEIKIIMLSNYDDYEYVRTALQYGAVDYLLKHNLSEKVLLDSLNRAGEFLSALDQSKTDGSLIKSTPNNILALKEKFLLNLLSGFYTADLDMDADIKVLGIRIDKTELVAVSMVIDDYQMLHAERQLRGISLLKLSILNISEEILAENENGLIGHVNNEKFAILLSFADTKSSALVESTLHHVLHQIGFCLKKYLGISVSFSIGQRCRSFKDIPHSFKSSESLLNDKFYTGKGSFLTASRVVSQKKEIHTGLSIQNEKELISHIREQNGERLNRLVEQIFQTIRIDNLTRYSAQIIFNDLLGIINKLFRENAIDQSQVFSGRSTPSEILASLETIDEVQTWMTGLFRDLLSKLERKADVMPYSDNVKRVIQYLRNHYLEDVSLQTAAEVVHLNSAYLSKIFKDDVGSTFTEYLNNLRIEKAKQLLAEQSMEIRDIISKCGFNNYTYFFNAFKKKVGMTPKQFIARQK